MPGAHTHIYTDILTLLFTLLHGPGSWTLQEKETRVKNEPAHGPPLQARVAAANRTVLAACKHDATTCDDPGAHGMNRGKAKQNERGQER